MINKILPWLSIRSKLIIAFVGLSIVPLVLVGIHSIFSNVHMMENIAIENLNHDVTTIREKSSNFLSGIESDLRTLRNSTLFEIFVNNSDNKKLDPDNRILKQINSELLSFCKTKNIYYQLRVINEKGDELLRIEDHNVNDSTHDFRTTALNELRHSRETYYFIMINNLLKDQIAFAPAELVHGKDKRVPVISFAMPIFVSSHRIGILIANVYAKEFFQVIESRPHLEKRGKVVLIRDDGNYLYHSEKKKDWNKLLASRVEDNLHNDYPADVVNKILSGNEGVVTEGVNEIISYAPLFPNPDFSSGGKIATGLTAKSYIFESVPKDVIMGPVRSFALTFTGFLLLFLVTAIGLGLLATRQFTKPILALQRGAEIIAEGNYGYRLHVETHDEIEKLAAQFNSMAASLEAHSLEIQQHRTRLEEMVKQRTRELTEEKMKLQAIIDNVPSAFVLLDKDFRIVTASAAFTEVTGFSLDEVRDKDCNAILCDNGFCRNCICRQAYQNNRIEGHVDRTEDKKGEERFIEHIAIPMNEDGKITSILEIITDITKRKQLEQHMIQAEKLMAAGEMSAIIAHEFRNLLTSIKIILQLQNESLHLSKDDKASLAVALNSIGHMESIVTELLNFARPKPMEFQKQELNNLVNESLAIAQLQFDKKGINVNKNLNSSLQPLLLDATHFKEALINILLNAAQSFDYVDNKSRLAEISINVRKTRIQKTLRDFSLVEETVNKNQKSIGKEILLKKGMECALIEITDNGSGMDRSNIKRIFDPFFTTKPDGTGLGLPMVKRTVNAHEGIITVTSKKGEGTKFDIFLPLNSKGGK
jgi:two-component system sensor histidine kinase AtoS